MKVFYSLSPKVKDLVYKCRNAGLNHINYRGTGIPIQTNRKALRIAGRFTIYFCLY